MVRREGTRFGVATSHHVRRSSFPYQHICSGQNVVIKTMTDLKEKRVHEQATAAVRNHLKNRTFTAKGFENDFTLTFSLNKSKRWEVIETLKQDAGISHFRGNRIIVAEHHILAGYRSGANCTGVYDSTIEAVKRSPKKTYASAADLISKGGEKEIVPVDKDFGKKNRRSKKRKVQMDEDGVQTDAYTVKVQYDVNVAAPRHAYHTLHKSAGVDDNVDGDDVIQTSKRGTKKRNKKRNKKSAQVCWDDIYLDGMWDLEDDYTDDWADQEECWQEETKDAEPVQTGAHILGAFLDCVMRSPQSRRQGSKNGLGTPSKVGPGTKGRIVQVDVADAMAVINGGQIQMEENTHEAEVNTTLMTAEKPSINVSVTTDSLYDDTLKWIFGGNYQKGSCIPRRIAINITSNIVDELKSNSSDQLADTLLQTGHHIYTIIDCVPAPQITLNDDLSLKENVKVKVSGVCDSQDMLTNAMTSEDIHRVSDVVKNISQAVASMPANSYLTENTTFSKKGKCLVTLETVLKALQWECSIDTLNQVRHEVLDADEPDAEECENGIPISVSSCGDREYCSICYEALTEECLSTALLACRHWFCDECWRNHLVARVMQGDTNITCPGFKCDTRVDPVTLMSFLPSVLFSRHRRHKLNTAIACRHHLQWCPNSLCGRLMKLKRGDTSNDGGMIAVSCECGSFWCSDCKEEAHWPATCQQAKVYRKEMQRILRNRMVQEVRVDAVDTKRCPRCDYPIEKHHGCNYMVCKCGLAFCWNCRTDMKTHDNSLCQKRTASYETFNFKYKPPTKSFFNMALVHYLRRTNTSIIQHLHKAKELAYKLAVAVGIQHVSSMCNDCKPNDDGGDDDDDTHSMTSSSSFLSLATSYTPKVVSLAWIKEEDGQHYLEETTDVLEDAARFVGEAEFVLEYLEVLFSTAPTSNQKRGLVQGKSRLAFISQQLDHIISGKVALDKQTCMKRVKKLLHCGKSCLRLTAKATSNLKSQMTPKKEL